MALSFYLNYPFLTTSKTAVAASMPLNVDLFLAWSILREVIIPFPIGFFDFIDKFNNAVKTELQIKSKWGVSPFITQPKAINPSKRFRFFEITTGIS